MGQTSNGSLRSGGLVAALFTGIALVIAGCPGPVPHEGVGGGGASASVSTSTSTSTTTSTTSSSSTSSSTTSSTSTTTSTTSSSSSSGPPTCGDSLVCIASPESPWSAPFFLFPGQLTANGGGLQCPANTAMLWSGGDALISPPLDCDCRCTQPTGVMCEASAAFASGQCPNVTPCSVPLPVGTVCTPLTDVGNCPMGPLSISLTADAKGGSCDPLMLNPPPPSQVWVNPYLACAPDNAPGPCEDGGICEPAADADAGPDGGGVANAGTLCIAGPPGMISDCPAPFTTTSMLLFTHLDDNRTCTSCGCGEVQSAQCTMGTAQLAPSLDCTGAATNGVPVPGCVAPPGSSLQGNSIKLMTSPTPTGGMCTTTGGSVMGTATPDARMAICCM